MGNGPLQPGIIFNKLHYPLRKVDRLLAVVSGLHDQIGCDKFKPGDFIHHRFYQGFFGGIPCHGPGQDVSQRRLNNLKRMVNGLSHRAEGDLGQLEFAFEELNHFCLQRLTNLAQHLGKIFPTAE